jgi:precorrin-3B synthase
MIPARRGACPTLAAPMQTGDGLLARIIPVGGIAPALFAGLCRAAQRHGNGMVEITQRGNIQVRGLSAASAPVFAEEFAGLDIGNAAGVAMTTNALAGLDSSEVFDGNVLLNQLRDALDGTDLPSTLDAKVSVVVDGGGALHLDALKADIRLRAIARPRRVQWHLAVVGTAEESTRLGAIAPEHAAEAVIQLLHVIAVRGPRARDVLRSEGADVFRAAIGPDLRDVPPPAKRPDADPIGIHALRGEGVALGLGLTFGCDALTFIDFANAVANAGAVEIRSAPGHALLIVGLSLPAATDLQIVAQRLGFVVRADDPRRHIAACAGAPVCCSGEIATRTLAPLIAGAARSLFDGSLQAHVSGCRKGCAHAAPAGLTIVGRGGRCGIVVNGSALDLPIAEISQQDLPETLARLAREVAAARRDGERVSDVLARWGNTRVAAVLAGELVGA